MDYRLQAIVDAAKRGKDYADQRAVQFRERGKGKDEVNASAEISIARLQAESTTYQWIVDQLGTFSIPPAGGVESTQVVTSNRDHQGSIGGCSQCTSKLRYVEESFDRMCSEAQAYGWNDSDTRSYKEQLARHLSDLADGLRLHN